MPHKIERDPNYYEELKNTKKVIVKEIPIYKRVFDKFKEELIALVRNDVDILDARGASFLVSHIATLREIPLRLRGSSVLFAASDMIKSLEKVFYLDSIYPFTTKNMPTQNIIIPYLIVPTRIYYSIHIYPQRIVFFDKPQQTSGFVSHYKDVVWDTEAFIFRKTLEIDTDGPGSGAVIVRYESDTVMPYFAIEVKTYFNAAP